MDKATVIEMIRPAFNSAPIGNIDVDDKIIACYPVENNMRIYTQQSAFTVHNSKRKLSSITNHNLLVKLVIPSKKKKDILEDLNICGISLRNVYPDVEHIAEELKTFYG